MFSKKEKVAPRHVRAIKSYTAQHETELSFQEGDELLQLDEMFSKKEKVAPRHVRAIKSYTAQHETELSFQEGDELLQLDESFGWLEGELNGVRGWFPHDHVEAMFSKKEKVAPRHVRAIKSYTAQHETELSFQEGDELLQLDESFGWLEGELNGVRGWFPHDHVEAVGPPLAQGGGIQPVDETEPEQGSSILSRRRMTSERLESFLTLRRPIRKDLENRNILPAGTAVGTNCSPQVVEAQKKLEKTKKAQVLSNFLKGSVIFRKKEALDTHGLFRLSGNQLDINKWKDALSAHDGFVDFKKENVDVHVVACLLKEYIRSLPEPPGLPEPNRIFLNYMLVFLKKVSMHADVNMMTSANLGIIFGPSFVQPKMVTMEKMMCPKPVEVVGQLIELGSIPAK
ncbi:LOW QUALITY PROTEIN: RhoGAP domain containing protein [Acanthamoeba castellanii str. Neff]|uniref:RhoGAP domain containing protein n=1 Tax=Acanthamoeba castellanii (strain ATCC 30010 / Neff) TaxID=1257118 RepID=L8GFL8_ACACF|nr:LOW QUALITY PROTEIN: RhoGAP domain containing protein [Acanthamoeba castellanii str. Neff]ELR11885.1 RhoGAP domain containing protein [Acanthamoeba castellanii str. Neff]